MTAIDRRVSVAPMMEWTDRHDRYFLRLISRRVLLYTEMVTTGALLHGPRERLLRHHPAEHPLAFQIGGCDPAEMADCARFVEDAGYGEININVGCPSDRVQNGRFGACLMAEPETVAACVAAMRDAVDIPVTVKSRIGIDDDDSYDSLARFVRTVAEAGCETFVVHARKAILAGLSPKQNREVPPLQYDKVWRLKREFPALEIVINGGIRTLPGIEDHLAQVDGVMIGREAYQNPYFLAEVDRRFFGAEDDIPERQAVVDALLPYIEREVADGVHLNRITRHILGLFQGERGARAWRRHLSENAHLPGAGTDVVRAAAARVGQG
ncbi:MAG: tRNA dihydrouridine(20/20a) synthase DusA [Acetobacterales bacterium]